MSNGDRTTLSLGPTNGDRANTPTLPMQQQASFFPCANVSATQGDAACAQCQGHRQQSPIKYLLSQTSRTQLME